MSSKLRKFVLYLLLPSAFAFVLFVGGFLQEFSPDDIPDAARAAGVVLPLDDPRIVVSLQKMTLTLFNGDTIVTRYNIGYGPGPSGRVTRREGSTPVGDFTIIRKEKREDLIGRGSRFLVFDFPTTEIADQSYEAGGLTDEQYMDILGAHRAGKMPPHDTPLGGPIGIQGNFFFFMDRRFTDGSIALSNGDINELYRYVTVGTPVTIER